MIPPTPIQETIDALEELVEDGKIRYYGLGHLSKQVVERYCQIGNPFSALVELSPVAKESYSSLLPLYQQHEVGIIAFSTTGRGLLTGKFTEKPDFDDGDIRNLDPLFQRERFKHGLRVYQKLTDIGERYGRSPTQMAIAWVLNQPEVICALTGPSTIKHMEENVGGSGWKIPEEDLTQLEAYLEREDRWLEKEQKRSLKQILSNQLQQPEQAFTDLIYAIETAITLNLVSERPIMPLFHDLYELKEKLNQRGIEPRLEEIQAKLHNLVHNKIHSKR